MKLFTARLNEIFWNLDLLLNTHVIFACSVALYKMEIKLSDNNKYNQNSKKQSKTKKKLKNKNKKQQPNTYLLEKQGARNNLYAAEYPRISPVIQLLQIFVMCLVIFFLTIKLRGKKWESKRAHLILDSLQFLLEM